MADKHVWPNNFVTITIDRNDLGQILEGLEAHRDNWERTADCFEAPEAMEEGYVMFECGSEAEARKITEHYSRIIRDITNQLTAKDHSAVLMEYSDKLGLGAKTETTEADKAALVRELLAGGQAEVADYVAALTVDELDDLLVNVVYG